jgi:hypothetical protein
MPPPPALPDDLEMLNHFSLLIYPFLHDITGDDWQARAEALEPRWTPWWLRLQDEELATALDDSSFFLPYIRGLLFPETVQLQGEPLGEGCSNWTRIIQSWAGKGLGAFCRGLRPGSVLRLTCQMPLREALGEFTVVQERMFENMPAVREEVPARMEWVDVLLFPGGVGFLLLKVGLRGEPQRLSSLIDLNYYLRTVLPPKLNWTLPTLHFAGAAEPLRMADLVDFLTQGLVSRSDKPLSDGVENLRSGNWRVAKPYTDTEAGQAYGERCQILMYACVYLADAGRAGPAGAFATGEDRLLFEVSSCVGLGTTLTNPLWAPAPDYAKRLINQNRLAVWRCWRALGLKDSYVFLATEDMDFTRRVLPHNIENDYLPLYLFTLYQKFQLFVFAADFMREVAQPDYGLKGVQRLMARFVNFRNRYWFNEVTRKALGTDLYRSMQQGLEVAGLYQLVTGSVREARDYVQQKNDRRRQMALTMLFLFFGPATVLFGTIKVFLTGDDPDWVKALLLSVLGVAAVAGGLYYWWRRRQRTAAVTRLDSVGEGDAAGGDV